MVYIKKLNSPQILIKQKKEVSQGKSFEKVINELRKEDRNTNFYDENFADLSKCTINLDHVLKVLDSSEIPFTFGTKTNRALFETQLIVQGSYNDSIQQ